MPTKLFRDANQYLRVLTDSASNATVWRNLRETHPDDDALSALLGTGESLWLDATGASPASDEGTQVYRDLVASVVDSALCKLLPEGSVGFEGNTDAELAVTVSAYLHRVRKFLCVESVVAEFLAASEESVTG